MRLTREQMKRLTDVDVFEAERLLQGSAFQFGTAHAEAVAIMSQARRVDCSTCNGQGRRPSLKRAGKTIRCQRCLGAGYKFHWGGRVYRRPKVSSSPFRRAQ